MSNNVAYSAREKFLSRAAGLLHESDQPLADRCRHNCLSLQTLGGTSTPKASEGSCPACGCLDIEEREVFIRQATKCPPDKTAAPTTSQPKHKLVLRVCRRCSRTVKQRLAINTTKRLVPGPSLSTLPVQERQGATITSVSQAAKISSKKRAKERKEKEGLKAMLDKNRESAKAPSSFSLMDFMSGAPK